MIPILFNKDEKTFTSLGLGQMDATLVEVERERNGNYTLYAEVPFNSQQAKHLTKEMLIKADAGSRTKWQTFKINRTIKDTNADVIKVYADHISMDTINDAMNPKVVIRQQTAEGALRQWANNLVSGKAYDVQSDITHVGSTEWTIDEVENARQALGGVSGSILDVWGGEYEFDNNTIILHKEMGRTAPTVLEYGRNIVSLEYEELIDGVYTSIYPYATYTPKSEDNKQLPDIMVTLDELIVDSEYADNYETKRIQIVDFSSEFDSNAENPEIPTQTKLRTLATAYVKNNGYGIPKISQEIDFVDLSKTLDYQDIQVMEEIELNDRVPVYYPNIDAETNDVKVTTTNWDVLNNRYSKITLSTIGAMNSNSITSKLSTAIKDLKAEQKKINNTVPYLINGQGNRVWWTTPDDNMEHKIDDTWFKKNGKYTIIYRWNGSMWEEVLNDETFITEIEAEVAKAQEEAEKASQSAKDADTRAGTAIEQAGANADLLTTHQSTLDTIKNTTIPNVNKVATDAMAEAKSALSSASSAMDEAKAVDGKIDTFKTEIGNTVSDVNAKAQKAIDDASLVDGKVETFKTDVGKTISTVSDSAKSAMDEAKKTDGKIADYVTRNGLVSGTTVDSKIDTATGEWSQNLSRVEGKIDGLQVGGRNLFAISEVPVHSRLEKTENTLTFINSYANSLGIKLGSILEVGKEYTISFKVKLLSGDGNSPGISGSIRFYDPLGESPVKQFGGRGEETISETFVLDSISKSYTIYFYGSSTGVYELKDIKIEKGNIATDWTPAPEDIYTQEEFKIFEASYNSSVEGINAKLGTVTNKVDDNGRAFTEFKENEYSRTAERVSDTFTKQETTTMLGGKADASQLSNYLAKSTYERDAEQSTLRFQTIETNKADTTYVESEVKNSADEIKTTLTNYAKATDLNGLATETYATNQAVSEAGKVKNELTKYAKTTDLTGLASETYATNVAVSEAGKVSSELTKYAKTTALTGLATQTYAQTQATTEAGKVEQKLTGYAKTTDLNGLATETYATNKAVAEAGKVKNELTKYELKTGVDSKISTASSALRTETAEKMKTVYTKSETETLLGEKADNSALSNYVQTATYESGIDGVSQSLTRVEGKIDGLQVGGRNLIPQSDFNSGIPTGGNSSKDGFQFSGVTYSNENGELKVVFSTGGNASSSRFVFWSAGDKLDLQKGDKVTLSFKGRTDSANNLCVRGGGTFITPITKEPMTSENGIHKITFEAPQRLANGAFVFWLENAGVVVFDWMKLELGSIATDWTPAPEDTLTQDEYKAFKSSYESTVQGISGQITTLGTNKLDGNTYTNFLSNDYKATADKATSAFTKVDKIVDASGNVKDNFSKAVYDQNATRQSADFKTVTDGLVKTATYTAGINGINSQITSVKGKIDDLSGARNLLKQSWHNSEDSPAIVNNNYGIKSWDLVKPLELGKTYTFRLFGFSNREYFNLYTPNGMMSLASGMSNGDSSVIRTDNPYNGFQNRRIWEKTFTLSQTQYNNMVANRVVLYNYPASNSGNGEVYWATLVEGTAGIDWSPSLTDQLGKAEFTVFKNTYEETAESVERRLTAIDSGAKGSLIYNTNLALSTAQGNTSSITTLDTKVSNLKVGGENLLSTTADGYADGYIVAIGNDGSPPVFSSDSSNTISGYIDIGNKGVEEEFVFSKKTVGSNPAIEHFRIVWISEYGNVLRRDAVSDNVFVTKSPSNAVKVRFSFPTGSQAMMQKGNKPTEYAPSLQDQLGKSEFTLFKNTYDSTSKSILSRLTAIDSSASGSVVSRLNATESTASGNSQLIATINSNYVKQSNIDTSILADKKIKDTRSTNQLPSWYFANYPSQEVREFKNVSAINVGSGTYGILTTNVPWTSTSGGTVKQRFETNTETHVRQSNSAGTAWGAWAKQIDTSDTTYQKVTQTSSLYERVLGSTENNLNTNISRIVQTSNVIQQTVTSAMNVENRNLLITKNATKDSWLTGGESYPKPSSQPNSGTSTSPDLIEVKSGDKFTLSKNETTLFFRVSFLNSSKAYISRYVQNAKLGTITPPSGTAYMWVSYPTNADAKVEKGEIATGYSPAPEDTATHSQITQLSDNINLKVSKSDLISQINVQAGGVLIQSGTNKLNITPTTTYIQNGTIKSAMIESLDAGKIKTGTLDASKATITNIDANNITANKTSFVQSVWNSLESSISINSTGLLSKASDNSQVYLQNGVVGARTPDGATVGQIGYAYETSSPWYSMQISNGSHFQIRMSRGTGELNKQAFYIMSGGRESYLNTDDIYLNPVNWATVQGRFRTQGETRIDAELFVAERLNFSKYGGYIRSQSNSNMQIYASNNLVVYAKGSNALEIDGTHAVFRRQISENSDMRLKTNIVDMPIDSLEAIRNLEIKKFDYLDGRLNQYGIIAQQAQNYLPELIDVDSEGYLMVNKSAMTYINMHAIQQLDSKVDDKVEQLEAKIATLQKELATLKGD